MKSLTKIVVSIACLASAASLALAAPKDITTRTNPDASLNVEARYLVHVGFSAAAGGLTSAVSVRSLGLVEIMSCGGNSGNWSLLNDGNVTSTTVPNTFGGAPPDYAGYRFNLPVKNLTTVKFWNRVYGDGGPFGATPELQYLDAPEPFGTWQTISDVTWNTPYIAVLGSPTIRAYTITVNQSPPVVWGVRLFGNALVVGTADATGFVGFAEIAVTGELDIGDINLSKNKALTATAIANAEQGAGETPRLNDANLTTRTQTWGPWAREDYYGMNWTTPQHRLAALGVCFQSFADGGLFDDCQDPVRIECTTVTDPTWHAVPGVVNKYRYPYLWQRLSYLGAAELGFLFTFDEVSYVTGLRIIGDPAGQGGDRDGFLGCYELEVFGKPVMGEVVNYDNSADGDVDAADLGLFINCWSGPAVPYTTAPNCADRDLDHDGDVDANDFGVFQRCYSGPGIAANPFCG